jgi:hypothetical protein
MLYAAVYSITFNIFIFVVHCVRKNNGPIVHLPDRI